MGIAPLRPGVRMEYIGKSESITYRNIEPERKGVSHPCNPAQVVAFDFPPNTTGHRRFDFRIEHYYYLGSRKYTKPVKDAVIDHKRKRQVIYLVVGIGGSVPRDIVVKVALLRIENPQLHPEIPRKIIIPE